MNPTRSALALALLTACGGSSSDPTTSDSGTSEPRFDGAAFEIDLTASTLVKPEGDTAQALMDLLLDDLTMVVQFRGDEASPSAISAVGFIEAGVFTQDLCSRTVSFDGSLSWSDPDVVIAAENWTFEAYDLSVPIRELDMSAVLSADGQTLEDFALSAHMDSEDFVVPKGETPPCELVGTFGVDCIACDDDPNRLECLSVELSDGTASRVEVGVDLVTVTAADVAARSDCETSD